MFIGNMQQGVYSVVICVGGRYIGKNRECIYILLRLQWLFWSLLGIYSLTRNDSH